MTKVSKKIFSMLLDLLMTVERKLVGILMQNLTAVVINQFIETSLLFVHFLHRKLMCGTCFKTILSLCIYTHAPPEVGYTVLPVSVPRYFSSHFSQQLLMAEI